ncbi:MAG: 2OG-Fe(II) oxygenase family protein [Pseudomonadota bacterium]
MATQLRGVPLIDLAGTEGDPVSEVAAACRDWGFFQVINHGVDAALIEGALAMSEAFFDLDPPEKRRCSRSLENPWGYYDRELTKNLRDRKEIFDIGQDDTVPWPARPAAFRATLAAFEAACYQLALRVTALAARGLGLDASALRPFFAPAHSSFMRLNYYPQEHALLADDDMPAAGPLGISPHTDAGGVTVLLQDSVSGLQVCHKDDWYDVEAVPGALTINIGDMMQVWANDQYYAALHRVLASRGRRRYSIAYFLNPGNDAVVSPLGKDAPRYRDIPWQEYRSLRAQGDYGDYGEEVQIKQYRSQAG